MQNEPMVSVIIPIYNRGFMLDKVLTALMNQTYPNVEVVLVDDGSTDDTAEVAKRFPKVRYIYKTDRVNRGAAATRNVGIAEAKGEVLYFTDSDVICPPDLLERHMYYHKRNPKLIVQGQLIRIVNLDDAFRIPYTNIHYSRAYFDAANVSVRKKYIDEIGGFDYKTLAHGWDDLETGLRLMKLGLGVKRMVKSGYIWHYEGDYSREGIVKFFNKRVEEGRKALDYYRKHPTFEVKMMVMASPFFYWLGRRLFKEEVILSDKFFNRVQELIDQDKSGMAIAKVRLNGYHFYLKGLQARIKEDGYVIKPKA